MFLWLCVQTASEVSESELGRKGSDLAQKTVERVSEQAEELRKTDVGQAVQKVCTQRQAYPDSSYRPI